MLTIYAETRPIHKLYNYLYEFVEWHRSKRTSVGLYNEDEQVDYS